MEQFNAKSKKEELNTNSRTKKNTFSAKEEVFSSASENTRSSQDENPYALRQAVEEHKKYDSHSEEHSESQSVLGENNVYSDRGYAYPEQFEVTSVPDDFTSSAEHVKEESFKPGTNLSGPGKDQIENEFILSKEKIPTHYRGNDVPGSSSPGTFSESSEAPYTVRMAALEDTGVPSESEKAVVKGSHGARLNRVEHVRNEYSPGKKSSEIFYSGSELPNANSFSDVKSGAEFNPSGSHSGSFSKSSDAPQTIGKAAAKSSGAVAKGGETAAKVGTEVAKKTGETAAKAVEKTFELSADVVSVTNPVSAGTKAASETAKSVKAIADHAKKTADKAKEAARQANSSSQGQAYTDHEADPKEEKKNKKISNAISGILITAKTLLTMLVTQIAIALVPIMGIVLIAVAGIIIIFTVTLPAYVSFFTDTDLLQEVVIQIDREYEDALVELETSITDSGMEWELTSEDGRTTIAWVEVLSLYAAQMSTDEDIDEFTPDQTDNLRSIVWDMYTFETAEPYSEEVYDEETGEFTGYVWYTEIVIKKKSVDELAEQYGFTELQLSRLEQYLNTRNSASWAKLLNGVAASTFLWPLPEEYTSVSSYYGHRSGASTSYIGTTDHKGIDIPAPANTEIFSVLDGVVIVNSYSDSAGNYIVIDHENGIYTIYMHMINPSPLSVGTEISQGDVIGYVGSTGNSTGNHLHLGVCVSDSGWNWNSFVDPAVYLGIY